jgi:hypothetical protein
LEQALRGSARDLGAGGPDDTFGFGLLDCYEAFFAAGRGPFPLAVTTTSLPSAQEGAAYGQLVRARGGFAPYAWSVTAGSLPPGLSVDARTGLISGNSAATGTSQLTIRVEDTAGSWASQPFTLVVYPVAPLTVAGSLPRSPTWGPRTWRSWRRAAA